MATNTKSENGKSSKKKGMTKGQMAAIGGGVAAVAAAGASAYYLMGPKAKTHQRKAKLLMTKMKKEATQTVSKAKDMTEPIYQNVIDALALKYSQKYREHEEDIRTIARKLKGEWRKRKAPAKTRRTNTTKSTKKQSTSRSRKPTKSS